MRSRGRCNSSILERELEELTKLGGSSLSDKPDSPELEESRYVDVGNDACDEEEEEGDGEFGNEEVRSENRGDVALLELHWTGIDSSGVIPGSSGI